MSTTLQTTVSPPHPSSTLVNISDDADLRLIRVLAPSTSDPTSFEDACASAISDGNAAGLLRTMIDKGVCSAEEFHGMLQKIDLEDGKSDGRSPV